MIKRRGFIPIRLRVDCGNEINIVAGGLYYFALGAQSIRILPPRRIVPDKIVVSELDPNVEGRVIKYQIILKDQILPIYGPEKPLYM